MKALTRLSLAIVALATFAAQSPAQSHAPEWVAFAPDGEGFTALMPKRPVAVAQQVYANGVDASGARYESADDERTTFVVWSMKGSTNYGPLGPGGYTSKGFPVGAAYLDAADELAWELLISPELQRLARAEVSNQRMAEMELGMTYGGEFELSGMPARRYYVSLEKERGLVYICGEGAQVYVVAALGADKSDPRLKQFLDSFALKSAATRPSVVGGDAHGAGVGIGPGRGGNVGGAAAGNTGGGDAAVDYSKPFKSAEVTKKAVITAKPEPGFTEQARKFNVTGTVRLRAILAATGEVTNISLVKSLPHGLNEKAIVAARQIRFVPAERDGQKVSQYVTLEYNFNIY
jgi:TonB family protein